MGRRLSTVVVMLMTGIILFSSQADASSTGYKKQQDEVKDQLDKTQDELDKVEGNISDLEDTQQGILNEIASVENDIAMTMASIIMIENDIAVKEQEIIVAQADLEEAIRIQNEQYEAMKVRIKYMYEKGSEDYIGLFAQVMTLGEWLTKSEYFTKLYSYDRRMLQVYQNTCEQVAILKANLEDEQEELQTSKEECEAEEALLEENKASLQRISADYAVQIENAKQTAAAYAKKIQEQNAKLKKLEEKRQKALAEEKRKAEEERRKKEQAAQGGSNPTISVVPTSAKEDIEAIDSCSGSDKGKQIAKYACQFIGNPYVAGGTSLTNGTDCSGFTYSVYKQYGYTIARNSYGQRSEGTEVAYENAQPGDIVCYAGHVGMYIGNGKIVHASSARTGIKISVATYKTIITIRRIV